MTIVKTLLLSTDNSSALTLEWQPEEGQLPCLYGTAISFEKISQLVYPRHSENKQENNRQNVRYAIEYLEELGIWNYLDEDTVHRSARSPKRFRLNLWSRNLAENLEYLSQRILDMSFEDSSYLSEDEREQAKSIYDLVEQSRLKHQDKIRSQCKHFTMLGTADPVDITSIYTSVDVFQGLSSQRALTIQNFIDAFDPNTNGLNRFGTESLDLQRMESSKKVEMLSKLILMGKAGSGKTTILKSLLLKCNEGSFHPDKLPIFIQLSIFSRKFDKSEKTLNLIDYIQSNIIGCGIEKTDLITLLKAGKVLIACDGFDEILSSVREDIVDALCDFIIQFHKNIFIIAGRFGSDRYKFSSESFAQVEIADFQRNQVEDFIVKWFKARRDDLESAKKGKELIKKLKETRHKPAADLATTPLLLHLICVFYDRWSYLPTNRAELYQRGIEALLSKWDEHKRVQREPEVTLSFDLSISERVKLLQYIASKTFRRSQYVFERKEVVKIISQFLKRYKKQSISLDQLQRDSETILNMICEQHGLLIAQTEEIISFSHLSYHEYFIAKDIAERKRLRYLLPYVGEQQWHEVFLLVAEIINYPDQLIDCVLQHTKTISANDDDLQQLLLWIDRKANAVAARLSHRNYQIGALRALYLTQNCKYNYDIAIHSIHKRGRAPSLSLGLGLAQTMGLDDSLVEDWNNFNIFANEIWMHLRAMSIDKELSSHLINLINLRRSNLGIELILPAYLEIRPHLEKLRGYDSTISQSGFNQFWQETMRTWSVNLLRDVEAAQSQFDQEHASLQLLLENLEQRKILHSYYYANFLAVECFFYAPNASDETWRKIQMEILLPSQT